MPHLLVVDDDPDIIALVRRYFSSQGFRVSEAGDSAQVRRLVAEDPFDVVLLDLTLAHEDGLEICRYLRMNWQGAILIVTGRGESVDRIVGLELGADDYVTKPFELRELLARVRSVLRRVRTPSPPSSLVGPLLHFAGFVLDLERRALAAQDGEDIALTTGEFELLRVLALHAQRVLSRDQIMGYLRGHDAGPYDRAIDVQIGRLRRKLKDDAQLIKSVRGSGYLFVPSVTRG